MGGVRVSDYHTKELRQGFNLQRDDCGADNATDCGSLLGWRHFHELADRLARLDFVDGYAVRVRAGDGRRRPRPRGHVEGVQLFYQIVVLSHEIIQRVVLLEDLGVHAARRVRDPVRFSTDPALEGPAAQWLRWGELEGGRARRQG